MLPFLAVVVALNHPLIEVLFQRNAFAPQDTDRTAAIFLAYSPMLPLTAVDYLHFRVRHAQHLRPGGVAPCRALT